jgi:hypothetical protein
MKLIYAIAVVMAALISMFNLAGPASASTLVVSNNILTGVTGLNVGGSSYDVKFVDGTCAGIFGACDVAHFNFSNQTDADAATSALVSALAGSTFASSPTTISGCQTNFASSDCFIWTPYEILAQRCIPTCSGPWVTASVDDVQPTGDFLSVSWLYEPSNSDFTNTYEDVWAVWTPSAVPEPASWIMMLAGFAGIGFMLRGRRGRGAPART